MASMTYVPIGLNAAKKRANAKDAQSMARRIGAHFYRRFWR